MTIKKPNKDLYNSGIDSSVGGKKTEQHHARESVKSAGQVQGDKQAKGKNTSSYWLGRVFKDVTRGIESPHYSMQVAYKGRRMSFSTGTGNKEAASQIAAGIYRDLLSLGVEATLAKHRPKTAKPDKVSTIGEWITAAKKVLGVNDSTFNQYATSLRKIAGDILAVKKTKSRFGPKRGGASEYRQKIDSMGLATLTPVAIQHWRLERVRRAKTPKDVSSAKTSCNSTIRQARSLFAPKVVKFMQGLRLPEAVPFEGVEFYEKQNSRYSSKIDAGEIVAAAHNQLAKTNPQAFIAFLLAIGAGLRRGEIDGLCWNQIDTKRCVIKVEVTDKAGLKTSDSQGEVDIDEDLAKLLQGFKARSKAKEGDFVIQSDGVRLENRGPQSWGQKYRANAVQAALVDWLRNYEQDGKKPLEKVQKPIHELRKELGSLMQKEHGIYAASRALRHSTVATTAAHYVDKKERTIVPIGSFITPSNVVEMPAVTQPKAIPAKKKKA